MAFSVEKIFLRQAFDFEPTPKTYLELCQIPTMELFSENS